MKILIINIRYFVSGGPERYMFDLIQYLEKKGHEIIPFSIKSKMNAPSKYEEYFANPLGGQEEVYFDNLKKTPKMALDVLSRLFYSFHVKKKLDTLIKKTKPDIAYILLHYNKLSPSIIDACKNNGLPVFIRLSDYFLMCPRPTLVRSNGALCEACIEKNFLSCIKNKCIKESWTASTLKALAIIFQTKILRVYDKVDKFICTNKFMETKMIEKGYPKNKLEIIPTFKEAQKKRHNPSQLDHEYILYFGRFGIEKAIDTLIYAYFKSHLYKKNIYLYLVGGNKEDLQLKLNFDQEKLFSKYCKVVNFINKEGVNYFIKKALYVVHPSRCYENLPNSILEAFSFNKAVITANIGSLPYVVNDKVGLLYEFEDIDDLSSKMLLLVKNELRKKLERSIPKHLEQYSIEIHYKKLMEVFNLSFNPE